MLSRLPAASPVDGLVAAVVVVVETTLPLASVTVVVVEPFALVVTVVVSVDEELLALDPEPLALAPALLPEALLPDPDRIEDAAEAFDEPMDMLMDRVPDC